MMTECVMHHFKYFGPEFRVKRCSHYKLCYVVEVDRILFGTEGFADYVDQSSGTPVVESHRQAMYERLVDRMMDGIPPESL